MKKKFVLWLFPCLLMAMTFVGCSNEPEAPIDTTESMLGYIVIEENTLYIDKVELVTLEDEERIKELGLTQQGDLPNGYHFYNPEIEKDEYELTDNTTYFFVDLNVLFVKENDDRNYTTTEKNEFMQHLTTEYTDTPPAQKVPFYVEVNDGKVVRILEEFAYTI